MARILILDGHAASALAFVRSLGRAGHWVAVGWHSGSVAPAARSRFCQRQLEYPPATKFRTRFVESIMKLARESSIDLVFPMTDFTILPLSCRREDFRGVSQLGLPAHSALELVSDKYQTICLAQELKIPTPKTVLARSVEDLNLTVDWPFPMVVKDRFSVRWIGEQGLVGSTSYAFSRKELEEKVASRIKIVGDVLLQEFTAGTGFGVSSFVADGKVRIPFTWERLREGDPRGSGSSARKSVRADAELLEFSRRLVLRTGLEGISMVEFKKDKRTGRIALMEINGRPWGSMQLPIASGLDYPKYLANWYLKGQRPPKEIAYKQGITCRWLAADLVHLRNLWKGKPAGWPVEYPNFWVNLAKVSLPWFPGLRYDDISWSDPRPGLTGLASWFRTQMWRRPQ